MRAYGPGTDVEDPGNDFVGVAFSDHADDFELSRAERDGVASFQRLKANEDTTYAIGLEIQKDI